jgi:hypothetical protein
MYFVGAVEILAGILVLISPLWGSPGGGGVAGSDHH